MSNTCVRCAYAKEWKKMESRKWGSRADSNTVNPLLVLFMWGLKQVILSVYTVGKNKKGKKIPSFQHIESSRGWEEDVLENVVVSE